MPQIEIAQQAYDALSPEAECHIWDRIARILFGVLLFDQNGEVC
ncbi:hypothetical protein [Methylobacterium dankookense]|uniref:Uncharacterized protein n=1 Tax=Methylobacterium dankookense TaxID=560405 RepID=A0A564G6M2_9HYPH|nr:hypothetical protein [Methylobacterium dankookense]GJD57230.1 hypothetical protein IFDJLNFL_3131 [Methylobacterium dankookense]VUF15702.1 hypothetical protein MTDSW087_05446 [Methylobacterium dankookense]